MARTLQDKKRQGAAAGARNGAAISEQTALAVEGRGAAVAQPAVMAMPPDDAVQGIGAPATALSDDIGPSTGRDGAGIVGAPVREAAATADLGSAGAGAGRILQGHIEADWRSIKGWVWDPTTPAERVRLELLDGETRLATTVASESRPGLILSGIGDGRHGFSIELTDGLIPEGRHVLHLRCADSGAEVPGSPIVLEDASPAPARKTLAGREVITDRMRPGLNLPWSTRLHSHARHNQSTTVPIDQQLLLLQRHTRLSGLISMSCRTPTSGAG